MSIVEPSGVYSHRPSEDEDRAQLSQRLRVVVLAMLAACAVVAAVGYWTGNGQTFWTCLAGLVVAGIAYRLDRGGDVDAAVFVLLLGLLGAVTTTMSVGGGIHDTGMILYPMIIAIGSLLLQPRAYRLLVALVIASVVGVWWLSWSGRVAPEFRWYTDISDLFAVTTVLIVQAIAVDLMAQGLFRSLRQARRENAERRVAEEEVRLLNAELERRVETRTTELAAVNEELESFSYSVSHDLRTPLRVASSYAEILDQEFASEWDPDARRLLERILASNSRMNVLIEELLRFSHLGRRQIVKQHVYMQAVARGVIDLLTAGAPERNVEWVVGKLPPAWADPLLIEQVYSNLIGNALKYTGKRERARIEVGFDEDGGLPSYFVRDDGVGFDMRHAKRLFAVFERFHREDEFEGSGIGLATAQRILVKHGGRIWAESEPGKGATFRFQLPAA